MHNSPAEPMPRNHVVSGVDTLTSDARCRSPRLRQPVGHAVVCPGLHGSAFSVGEFLAHAHGRFWREMSNTGHDIHIWVTIPHARRRKDMLAAVLSLTVIAMPAGDHSSELWVKESQNPVHLPQNPFRWSPGLGSPPPPSPPQKDCRCTRTSRIGVLICTVGGDRDGEVCITEASYCAGQTYEGRYACNAYSSDTPTAHNYYTSADGEAWCEETCGDRKYHAYIDRPKPP